MGGRDSGVPGGWQWESPGNFAAQMSRKLGAIRARHRARTALSCGEKVNEHFCAHSDAEPPTPPTPSSRRKWCGVEMLSVGDRCGLGPPMDTNGHEWGKAGSRTFRDPALATASLVPSPAFPIRVHSCPFVVKDSGSARQGIGRTGHPPLARSKRRFHEMPTTSQPKK